MPLSIAQLATKHGIKPLKKYGQNFIYDETLCDKISRYAQINETSNVLEIGPGPAGLSRSILKMNPAKLTAIETDERCINLLKEVQLFYPKLKIIHADALRVNLSDITNGKVDIIANLPYNIGCKLLTNWLNQIEYVNAITVMLQKEVVERIVSRPNSKNYGRISIFSQILCHTEKCFDVTRNAFYPKPKVDSAIVRLLPKEHLPPKEVLCLVEKITRHAFSSRRKVLKSSLKKIIPDIDLLYQKFEFNDKIRCEDLSPDDYLGMANFIINLNN
ncbi:MAG TPA: 16S rRNA (adenine(1518)-N(6)/adenine(1519)-N(6))-dimethyltransferase RsmA [Candidatus Megaira endosymbiont of Nemacystus decipiens]|nr:16S rRNA (adenine(1518)-N(6)/adenine(1519)-N(6))-dimethyltransferase RsmA [Candidatus Megaera endosymbiont of Nemacystus decipiens]